MQRSFLQFVTCAWLLISLSGCTSTVRQAPIGQILPSEQMQSLLRTANLKHRAIVKPEVDEAVIVKRFSRDTSEYTLNYQIVGAMDNGTLTTEQAKNDVNMLFYNLQTKYGLYEYFGGDETFDSSREVILQTCDQTDALVPEDLAEIMIANLSFVKDGHFLIGAQQVAPTIVPLHYRDVDFEKTDAGYRNIATRKLVTSVDDYEDLDNLFRCSISNEGAIVYYPVVLTELARGVSTNPDHMPGNITVNYEDGTAQILFCVPYTSDLSKERATVELYKNRSIPVLFSSIMAFERGSEQQAANDFLTYAERLRHEPIMILDLRSNVGGNGSLPHKWLKAYTGESATGNTYFVEHGTKFFGDSNSLSELPGGRDIGGGLTLYEEQPDVFIENDNLIIVLISKYTASAAECMVDLLHNLRNVLFIGDPTSGYFLGDSLHHGYKLPCSLIPVQFGVTQRFFPEGGYFQEMRGFLPDLWVPAADAEQMAINLIVSNVSNDR